MEVLQACSKNYDLCQRLPRVLARLESEQLERVDVTVTLRPLAPARRRNLPAPVVKHIVQQYELGASTRAVAAAHGISKTQVIRILKAHGVLRSRNLASSAQIDLAVELYMSGLSMVETAKRLGMSPPALGRAFDKRGVRRRSRGRPQAE